MRADGQDAVRVTWARLWLLAATLAVTVIREAYRSSRGWRRG